MRFASLSGFGTPVVVNQRLDNANQKHHTGQRQHDGVGLHRLVLHGTVPPRHAEGGDVPPGVPAGQGQGQQEQRRGERDGAVAGGLQREVGQHHRAECGNGSADARVDAEVVGPLRWREHHEEHGQGNNEHHPLRRCLVRARDATPARHAPQDQHHAQHQGEHGEAALQRGVHRLLEQRCVAHPLLVPVQRRAHLGAHGGCLQHGGQGLVLKHRHHHGHAGTQEGSNVGEHRSHCLPTPHRPKHRRQTNQEHAHCTQTRRATRQGQRSRDRA